jgi:hypothetical protein
VKGCCCNDWGTSPKGREASDIVWVEHAGKVLQELVALSDELFRFLTLPISKCLRGAEHVVLPPLVYARNSMFPRSPPLNADQFIPYLRR